MSYTRVARPLTALSLAHDIPDRDAFKLQKHLTAEMSALTFHINKQLAELCKNRHIN